MQSRRLADWLELVLAAITAIAGVYVLVTTIAMVIGDWSPLPYGDQWDELVFNKGQLLSSWLYSQHNEHRILFPRLIFAIDSFLFSGTNRFNFFCNIFFPLCLVILVTYVAGRGRGQPLRSRVWIVGVALTLVFAAIQQENFVWGFQSAFFLVELMAVASFAILVLAKPSFLTLLGAVLCEGVAVYTMAGGMAVPFLAVPLAFWARRPKSQVTLLTAVALLLLASYLHGYHTPGDLSDPARTAIQVRGVAAHAFAQLGGPLGIVLSHFGFDVGWAVRAGQFGFVLFLVAAIVLLRHRDAGRRPEMVFLAAAAFGFAIALLTGLGRLKFGVGQALSSRYATPALLFWLSLAVIAMIYVDRAYPRLRLAVMVLTLPCLVGLAGSQFMFVKVAGRDMPLNRLNATTALLANVADEAALIKVHPDPSKVITHAAMLRASHLSIFAEPWSDWLGTKLADHVAFANPNECRGAFNKVRPVVQASGQPGWQANGSAWDIASNTVADRVVLTDIGGRVVGYALTAHASRQGGEVDGEWYGHFASDDPSTVSAFALLDGGRRACPLGHPRVVASLPVLTISDTHPANLPIGGNVDSIMYGADAIMILGWGLLPGEGGSGHVALDTNLPVASSELGFVARPDVVTGTRDPRLAESGILIRLQLQSGAPQPPKPRICIWTDDATYGRHLLPIPEHPELCPADSP